jgi:hypothetical protein
MKDGPEGTKAKLQIEGRAHVQSQTVDMVQNRCFSGKLQSKCLLPHSEMRHHLPQTILRNTSHECKAISDWLTRRYSKRLSQWPSSSQNALPLLTKTGCTSCYGRYRISGAPTSTTDLYLFLYNVICLLVTFPPLH